MIELPITCDDMHRSDLYVIGKVALYIEIVILSPQLVIVDYEF